METAIVWFRVQGVGLRIWRLGLMFKGLEFRVCCPSCHGPNLASYLIHRALLLRRPNHFNRSFHGLDNSHPWATITTPLKKSHLVNSFCGLFVQAEAGGDGGVSGTSPKP